MCLYSDDRVLIGIEFRWPPKRLHSDGVLLKLICLSFEVLLADVLEEPLQGWRSSEDARGKE